MSSMPLQAHLVELQRRLKYCLIFLGIGLLIAFLLREPLLAIVSSPHQWAMGKLNLPSQLVVLKYQDSFISQIKICLMGGLIIASPFIIYELLKFIEPGLKASERRSLLFVYFPGVLMLFLSGAVFSYFLLIPYGLYFMLMFGTEVGLSPMINFADYVSLFSILVLLTALAFELPIVMVLLSRIGLFSAGDYKKSRRYAIVVAVIVGAILTPPDPVTQLLLAIPLILLYEVGVFVTRFTEKKQQQKALLTQSDS